MKNFISILCLLGFVSVSAWAVDSKNRVFFVSPKDGATVRQKFMVKMGLEGKKLRPAGEDAEDKTTGHHHLLINTGPIAAGTVIPMDDNHRHFGKAQKEAELTLPPGQYTLTLQFADGAHRSYGPEFAQSIKIHVK